MEEIQGDEDKKKIIGRDEQRHVPKRDQDIPSSYQESPFKSNL